MMSKNQITVFLFSFLIVGFFLLSIPKAGFSGSVFGGPPCCQFEGPECVGPISEFDCVEEDGTFFPTLICVPGPGGQLGTCETAIPQIPTLNQWGMIIMAGVLGLFALMGIFATRRRNVLKTH